MQLPSPVDLGLSSLPRKIAIINTNKVYLSNKKKNWYNYRIYLIDVLRGRNMKVSM